MTTLNVICVTCILLIQVERMCYISATYIQGGLFPSFTLSCQVIIMLLLKQISKMKVVLLTLLFFITIATTVQASCNITLTSRSGSFKSPYYPQMYNRTYCYYSIFVPSGYIIRLHWQTFDVGTPQTFSKCHGDKVTVYNGYKRPGTKKVELCGQKKKSFSSTSNRLTVVFDGRTSRKYRGFYAVYDTTLPSITGTPKRPVTPSRVSTSSYISKTVIFKNSTCTRYQWYHNTPQGKVPYKITITCTKGVSVVTIIAVSVSIFICAIIAGIFYTIKRRRGPHFVRL
ncbi:Deleted in malignant brain tumors 1 protein [Trichoplax sp. H2]|nr:Deleted in malignant brain tumors 1 protein [Trichoplax sp. H2]|eukprot:RDD38346.1 Deleted in malignant brain tumors 1 protein [Trichoplax sp. H2]